MCGCARGLTGACGFGSKDTGDGGCGFRRRGTGHGSAALSRGRSVCRDGVGMERWGWNIPITRRGHAAQTAETTRGRSRERRILRSYNAAGTRPATPCIMTRLAPSRASACAAPPPSPPRLHPHSTTHSPTARIHDDGSRACQRLAAQTQLRGMCGVRRASVPRRSAHVVPLRAMRPAPSTCSSFRPLCAYPAAHADTGRDCDPARLCGSCSIWGVGSGEPRGRVVMLRARPGLKAQAWARPEQAWA
ncbi:hypothetical protein B0H10DRAFT_1956794 [Mycena sp. CBHHK59/15]|nr:hypothetical protein B0H10DRAFT_1956794 [Mycena sp. CBHHK59/15]